ncbi:MAG: response regulator [Deltaproteobacteria bacterium]|nr:response regulator [Deltaproteobacteria bacterium]MBW1719342.1 response regulator [Deltaproteobacteria bacterium]MBW1964913.1 response regulator [Deltaproteobacteria bacterium]MBW2080661.1 response regulator [Deltaproteobacteria bacterium]
MATILVVEDDNQIRNMLRIALERKGYDVIEAENGVKAMSLQRKTPADLVITDIIMPEKDGIDTMKELKAEFPKVKIIAMSGGKRGGPENYLRLAEMFNADKTIAKPFHLEEVLTDVKELLD